MADGDGQALLLQVSYDLRALERQNKRLLDTVSAGANAAEARIARIGSTAPTGLSRIGAAIERVFDSSRLRILDAGAARISVFGSALDGLGATGLVAAAGVAAVGAALAQAHGAAQYAQSLADAASRLSITTDALQQYRFAIHEAGGAEADADTALAAFSVTLGSAQGGVRRALAGFHALGITPEQVRSFRDSDEAIVSVTQHLAGLSNQAKDAALERLGLGPLAPLLEQGIDRMRELRTEAQRIGVVMDASLIQRGAAANHQFETLAHVVDVELKSAFVDLAPVLNDVLRLAISIASEIGDIVSSLSHLENRRTSYLQNRHTALINDLAPTLQNRALDLFNPIRRAQNVAELAQTDLELGRRQSADSSATRPPAGRSLIPPEATPHHTPAGPRNDSAEINNEIDRLVANANKALLTATLAATDDTEERGRIQREIIEQDRQAALAGVEAERLKIARDRGITDAQRETLTARLGVVRSLVNQEADQQAIESKTAQEAALQSQIISADRLVSGLDDRLRTARSALATSSEERLHLALENFQNQQGVEREEFREQQRLLVVRKEITEATANERIAQLKVTQAAERRAEQDRQLRQANPLFDFGHPTDSVGTDIQTAEVRGLNTLTDGITEAITKTHDLGAAFHDVANQIIADLVRIGVQRLITQPLANLLFGSGGNNGSGSGVVGAILSSAGNFLSPGHNAGGTDDWRGGPTWVGERGPELLNLPKGSQIIPNSTLKGLSAIGAAGAASGNIHLSINLDGANGDTTIRRIAYQAAAEGTRRAIEVSRRSAPGWVAQRQREG